MPRPTSPHPDAERKSASPLHPRNRHLGRYDFPRLIAGSPELERFVILNPYGRQSIDFADPAAVKAFNRALLQQFYDVREWDIPDGYLCPPIPGRADYLHYLADLLGASHDGLIPRGPGLRALDVGTGANCIYPLLGHHEYGWRFVGADIDPQSLASAAAILAANPRFAAAIELRRQPDRRQIFQGLIGVDERFDMTLCNPPFHASLDEATRGSRRKWKNLGKLDPTRTLPLLNFGGQGAEAVLRGRRSGLPGRHGRGKPGVRHAGVLVHHPGIQGEQPAEPPGAPEDVGRQRYPRGGHGPGTEAEPLRRLDLPRQEAAPGLAQGALDSSPPGTTGRIASTPLHPDPLPSQESDTPRCPFVTSFFYDRSGQIKAAHPQAYILFLDLA